MQPIITHAMLFCAGLGTRLKPFTDSHPKALAMVNGKSLLQRNIEYLQSAGINNVVVNVHHFADQIIEQIEKHKGWGSHIAVSDERDAVLETGGGLKRAGWFFKDANHFILMNVDILTDLNLNAIMEHHLHHQPLATLATTSRNTSRYFLFNDQEILCGWRNVTTGAEKIIRDEQPLFQKAFSGIHVINTALLSLMQQEGKFSIVDVYLQLAKENNILSFDHSDGKFLDVGKPESLLQAASMFD